MTNGDLATSRGLTILSPSDDRHDFPGTFNTVLDQLAAMIPYFGTAAGTTDANGDADITHGLGFTPSAVFAQSTDNGLGLHAALNLAVSGYTSTKFTIRLLGGYGAGGGNFYVGQGSRSFGIKWLAFR